MKAAVVPGPGARWELRDVPDPEPGPGQVLVKVHACGVCHNDVWLTNGVYSLPGIDPVVVGHEAAGEVVAVGAGVTARQVGDRVGTTWIQAGCGRCEYCRKNPGLLTGRTGMNCAKPVMTGMTSQGAHAQLIAVTAQSTVLLPDALSYEHAAPMLCAGYTAWSALRAAEPQPLERVAVVGIGGLGHLAVQFAKACGFETVAVTRTPDKTAAARELGADLVVSDGAGLVAAGGADVILVTGLSQETAADALAGLRPGGRMVLANIDVSGGLRIGPERLLWANGQRVLGAGHDGLHLLTEALDLAASGRVTPRTELFPMERVAEAVDRAAKGDVRFRAVVQY